MSEYYRIIPLCENVYRITSEENVFMELFVGEHHALLFDTGMGYGDLAGCVRSVTQLPLYIVNSHGHPDHMGGNFQFDEEIYIHPDDIPLLRQYNAERALFLPDGDCTCEGFDADAYINAPEGKLVPVRQGHVFDLGGLMLEVTELPGHTAGSIGLICRERRSLYASDAINGWVWMFLRESLPLKTYRATLEKAQGIDFDLLFTGHGESPEPKDNFRKFTDAANGVDFGSAPPDTTIPEPYSNGDVRICVRPGYTLEDRAAPGFAAVIISAEKL